MANRSSPRTVALLLAAITSFIVLLAATIYLASPVQRRA